MNRSLVFLDTETTGLEPGYHEIIEVCMAKLEHKVASTIEFPERHGLYFLIKPRFPERFDPKALAANGYSEAEWTQKGAIEFSSSISSKIIDFMYGCTIVGFNPWFDLRFLMSQISCSHELIGTKINYHAIDLCSMAYPLKVAGKIKSVSARAICKFFDIDYSQAHRACEDVDLSIECYRKLLAYYSKL